MQRLSTALPSFPLSHLCPLIRPDLRRRPAGGGSRFESPSVDGTLVDWCRTWAADCGQPAAQAFCELKGFAGAADFKMAAAVAAKTIIPSTGQTCETGVNNDGCNSFEFILCRS